MGCPMFERQNAIKPPTEYPFQSLYRPWSWILSSFNNVALLAILVILAYALLRRRFKAKKVPKFTYRRVVCGAKGQDESKTSVLVTGGSGNLGRHLVQRLIQDGGYEVHSLDLFIPQEMADSVTSYIKGDITSSDDLSMAFTATRPEVVFHTAALISSVRFHSSDLYRVNTGGTQCLVDACRKHPSVKRLVYTSTCDVLMSQDKNQTLDRADEAFPYPEKPLNAYCGSKAKAEKIILDAHSSDLSTCVLRPSILAGSDSLLTKGLLTQQGAYIGPGTNKFCVVEVGACADGHVLAEKSLKERPTQIGGNVYHLAGVECAVKDFFNYTIDDSGYTVWGYPPRWSIPKWLASMVAFLNVLIFAITGYCIVDSSFDLNAVEFLSRSYTFNSGKAMRELGWPEHPSWQEVALNTVEECQSLNHHTKKDK